MENDRAQQEHHSVKKVRLQGPAECTADLRRMVNNCTFSDIVFVCNDEKRVHALRKLVAGRSEMLKKLLLNGMAETTQSEIELPEISSRALLSLLDFLYTGTLLDYRPESWATSCELILVSRFFILPTLENTLRIFMHEQISSVAKDKAKAASLLTEALESGLCGERDVFLEELIIILASYHSDSHYVENLSEDAFQYLLANTKTKRENDGRLTLREYNRFRQVILWWLYKSELGSEAKGNLVRFIEEAEEGAVSLCEHRGASPREGALSFVNDLTLCQLHDDASKNSLKRLLSNIDWTRIHPILLSKVVVPLKLISATEILNSFRFHALHRDIALCVPPEYIWDRDENCRPFEWPNLGIQKAASKIGLAVLKEAVGFDIYFELNEVCEDFVELGFFNYSSEVGAERSEFGGKRLSDQDHALVLKFQGNQVSVKLEGPLGRVDWKSLKNYSSIEKVKGEVVRLSFDGSQHECSLYLGKSKRDFGVTWKNLPRRLYYPAVSFGDSSKGQVSIYLSKY